MRGKIIPQFGFAFPRRTIQVQFQLVTRREEETTEGETERERGIFLKTIGGLNGP